MIPGRNIWFVAFNIGRRRDKQRDTMLWSPRNLFITCVNKLRTNWRNWGQAKENSTLQMWRTSKRRNTVIIWKSTPVFINTPFEWVPLFTAEKFNDRPGLNKDTTPPPPQTMKGALIWNLKCLKRHSFRNFVRMTKQKFSSVRYFLLFTIRKFTNKFCSDFPQTNFLSCVFYFV